MSLFQLFISAALVTNVILGIVVFHTNSKRTTNKSFLTMSITISAWLACVGLASSARDAGWIEFWIRQSSVAAVFIPIAFSLLRISIATSTLTWRQALASTRAWLLCSLLIGILCQTQHFIRGVTLVHPVAEPQYGPGFAVFLSYFIIALIVMITRFGVDARQASGIQRTELQFCFLGCTTGLLVGVVTALIVPWLSGSGASVQFLPLSVLALVAILAYGIATQRILGVAEVLRRASAYALLILYLLLVYGAVWGASSIVLNGMVGYGHGVAHFLAALAVGFSLAPAHGWMQRFANRLFINKHVIDVGGVVQDASKLLQSVTTLPELLRSFGQIVLDVFGSEYIMIFLREGNAFEQAYPLPTPSDTTWLHHHDPLIEALENTHAPLVAETLLRKRGAAGMASAVSQMQRLGAASAVGVYSKRALEAVVLLGPRVSRRMYGATEQDTLQILCDQFAVAIENARLYTQLQDGKVYNDILLENLVGGVIAVNARGSVTVFNREAHRITGLSAEDILGEDVDDLPEPFSAAMRRALDEEESLRDEEALLKMAGGEDDVPVRMGTAVLRGHHGGIIGAILVFNDLTRLKKLEDQVRRTDRLASLGTLAAGMAHEIKNPLVTIKTFTQLLPERYQDEDFRETFSSLIGHEVKRIDSIVVQLLNFVRPTKPSLSPTSLHGLIEQTLRLVKEQLKQKDIEMHVELGAARDVVNADASVLEQALINFFLNAIESMESGGTFRVTTTMFDDTDAGSTLWGDQPPRRRIRVSISDTGRGIPAEELPRIFDPFFTTKDEGTGLGLAVSHGIIQDHGGIIDVESDGQTGTTFHIEFPLIHEEVVA